MALPVIAGIAGGIGLAGGLVNMFRGSPKYQAPDMETLRRQNPELYQAVMDMRRQASVCGQMADRRQGSTPGQQQMMQQQQSHIREQMANRGLVGTSAGTQMQAAAGSQMQNQALEQALRERMALMQGGQQANLAALQGYGQAMAPYQQQAMMDYQGQMQNRQAQNQFFSGWFLRSKT